MTPKPDCHSIRPTPRPWRLEGRRVVALKNKSVCELPQGGVLHGKVDTANGQLIVAAHDMLDVVRAVAKYRGNVLAVIEQAERILKGLR